VITELDKAEILREYGIISHFATNVKIYSSSFHIEYITNLDDLRFWCKNNRGRKLFILDEAGKSLRRRTPMSKLNIKLLDQLQILRKHKLSLILVFPHEKYIDSATLGSDVLDAVIIKPNFQNRHIAIIYDLLQDDQTTFTGIPGTSIDFDTWDVAPFKEHGVAIKPKFKDKDLTVLWEWSHGKTAKEIGLDRKQIHRISTKFIKEVLERDVTSDVTKR